MNIIEIKEWTEHFGDLLSETPRLLEVRKNDRRYKAGDVLKICEWQHETEAFTGRAVYRRVDRVHLSPHVRPGWVILQLSLMDCPWELTDTGKEAIGVGAVNEIGADVVKQLRAPFKEELFACESESACSAVLAIKGS